MSPKRSMWVLGPVVLVGVLAAVLAMWRPRVPEAEVRVPGVETEKISVTDYHPPPRPARPLAVADRLADKVPAFDPDLIDRRPDGAWLVNLSAAVIALDVLMLLPDREPALVELYPSYEVAMAKVGWYNEVLPSVNMIDGKAKQFDDGLVAALRQASFQGKSPKLPDPIGVVKRLLAAVGPDSPAAPFLAAGLSLIGEQAAVAPALEKAKRGYLAVFEANPVVSRPIGFYTWNKTLFNGYRFGRFFQRPFRNDEQVIPRILATALEHDRALEQ